MGEGSIQEPRHPVSRRQLIRRGMIAGGVALWSAPVVAAAAFSRNDHDRARQEVLDRLNRGGTPESPPVGGPAPTPGPSTTAVGCTGYPPGTCLTFVCGGSHTSCGTGAGGFDCFCDVDATSACVCRNDAHCSDLASCNPANGNADCAPGYFCLPTTCCPGPKCAPPCGTLPDGARTASTTSGFLPAFNSFLPAGTLNGI